MNITFKQYILIIVEWRDLRKSCSKEPNPWMLVNSKQWTPGKVFFLKIVSTSLRQKFICFSVIWWKALMCCLLIRQFRYLDNHIALDKWWNLVFPRDWTKWNNSFPICWITINKRQLEKTHNFLLRTLACVLLKCNENLPQEKFGFTNQLFIS